jgi:hypothetical protein
VEDAKPPAPSHDGNGRRRGVRETKEHTMLAYDYPLLGLFWTMMIFFLWASWLFAAIWSFIDNFRRRDHSGWAKAVWAIFIVVIPLIGVFAYLLSRPNTEPYVAEYATS